VENQPQFNIVHRVPKKVPPNSWQ